MNHDTPCQSLQECSIETKDSIIAINEHLIQIDEKMEKLSKLENSIETIADILTAWNNSKGFAVTLLSLGRLVMFAAACYGALKVIEGAMK